MRERESGYHQVFSNRDLGMNHIAELLFLEQMLRVQSTYPMQVLRNLLVRDWQT